MNKRNKLGLIIEYTANGSNELLSLNTDSKWENNVGEIAEIKQVDRPNSQDWCILVLQSIEYGHIIRIIIPNTGRNDYISASIFMPYGIIISGKELENVISKTKSELFDWKKETSKAVLSSLFSESYKMVDLYKKPIEESPNKIAYRYYGVYYQLYELMDKLNQSYYDSYKYIFLFESESGISCKGDDLTNKDLIESMILNPPSIVDGFEPYIDGQKFNQARYAFEGDNITIEWKRKGYKTIRKEIKVQKEIECPKPSPNEYVIEYPYEYIRVKDENGQEIEDYNLWIDGSLIRKGKVAEISEAKKSQSQVEVSANGYEEYKQSHDLRAIRYLDIRLKKKKYSYTFVLYSKDNEELEVEYSTTKKYLNSSPIEGYKTRDYIKNGVKNILEYSPSLSKSMKIVIGVACAIALFMGIAGGFYFTKQFYADKISSLQLKVEEVNKELSQRKVAQSLEQPIEESHMSNDNWDRIVKYLDKQKKWKKDEMDKFPEIVGLWDAINSYDKRAIESFQVNLSRSENYKRLLEAIANVKTQLSGPYNKENDFVITVDSYIKNLIKKTAEGNDSEKKNNEDQDAWM